MRAHRNYFGGIAACGVLLTLACAPAIKSTAKSDVTRDQMAELWERPQDIQGRDLFWGPWGRKLAPKTNQTFRVKAEKTDGYSPGFTLEDEDGHEWSVKQGPEAQTEVVVSRILSAVGYHQPPVYFVPRWKQHGAGSEPIQQWGRFRPKHAGIKDRGEWSWQQNPFVGTPPYQGLLALLFMLNGTDLKNENNSLYDVEAPVPGAASAMQWYVVRDVGAALGETGRIDPRRGDPFVFEKKPFILGVEEGFVKFDYHGRHQELAKQIRPEDVRWMANLVSQLTPRQWRDAFHAAGYDRRSSDMFIARIREKIVEAQQLPVPPVVRTASSAR